MRAMILAAGQGKRMLPITKHTPKPLLEVGGLPLIAYHFLALARAGFKEVVVNVSYLAKKIVQSLGDGSQYGIKIVYSFEPEVGGLETGGGIFQALPFLGNEPFLVISGDVWLEYDFAKLPRQIVGLAHLFMVPNPDFNPQGDFDLQDNLIMSVAQPTLTFASFGIYHPDLFAHCSPGFFRLTEVLLPAIEKKLVTGEIFTGKWHNIGTPEQWQALCADRLFSPS